MPFFPLYKTQVSEVLKNISDAMEAFSNARPDLLSRSMGTEPKLITPISTLDMKKRLIIAVDGGSRSIHFKWISASFAHAVATGGSIATSDRWTIPDYKDQLFAFTLCKQRIKGVNDYIRTSIELQTAINAAIKERDEKPLLLMDGSLANMYRFIARSLPETSFFVNRSRLVDVNWMKTSLIELLNAGIEVVAISKDSRVKHLPTVERSVKGGYPGKIVVADPLEFAEEDVISRKSVGSTPYLWLLFARFTDKGRVYRVEIPLREEGERDITKIEGALSLIRASVEVQEPTMMPVKRLGYPYPLACVDALARVESADGEWIRHEILHITKKYYPFLEDFFMPETGEAVHTR